VATIVSEPASSVFRAAAKNLSWNFHGSSIDAAAHRAAATAHGIIKKHDVRVMESRS